MSALYGTGNKELLTKMVANIFAQAPAYRDDLQNTLLSIVMLCHRTCQQYQQDGCEIYLGELADSIAVPIEHQQSLSSLNEQQRVDLLTFVADTCVTVHSFVEVFPDCHAEVHSSHLGAGLACLLNNVLNPLQESCEVTSTDAAGTALLLHGLYHRTLTQGLQCLRAVIVSIYSQPLHVMATRDTDAPEGSVQLERDEFEQHVFECLTQLLTYPWLCEQIKDGHVLTDVFFQLSECQLDPTQLTYYKTVLVSDAPLAVPVSLRDLTSVSASAATSRAVPVSTRDPNLEASSGASARQLEATASAAPNSAAIAMIRDMMPELGEGFIAQALAACGVCSNACW
jgi:activating signal cointegrator complex subunit 2